MKPIPKLGAALLVMAGLSAAVAGASEAVIRQGFQAKFPNAAVESVTPTPFAGIYEVVFNGQIAYTDAKINFVFFGNLVDLRGGAERSLTRERSAQLASQTLRKSQGNAVKRVRGNGKRVIYTFEDPNCGYCRELQKELLKMSDITIYTFLWPILSPDSVDKSRAVWCSKDRAKSWDDLMSRGVVPPDGVKCEAPFEKNHELAQRFGIRGTPAIFLTDGRQVGGGFVPASELEKALGTVK